MPQGSNRCSSAVDAQRDTPEVMQQYTQSFDPRIIGLTGTSEEIAAVAQEYGAYMSVIELVPAATTTSWTTAHTFTL